jgi:hypothetical protein
VTRPLHLLLVATLATNAHAEEIILKSGGRATLADIGLIQAPQTLGGSDAGNVLNLTYATRNWTPVHLAQDTKSLCKVHGLETHAELVKKWKNKDEELSQRMRALGFDLDGDLAGIEIRMLPAGETGGFTLSYDKLFDMRGLTKCRPVD